MASKVSLLKLEISNLCSQDVFSYGVIGSEMFRGRFERPKYQPLIDLSTIRPMAKTDREIKDGRGMDLLDIRNVVPGKLSRSVNIKVVRRKAIENASVEEVKS